MCAEYRLGRLTKAMILIKYSLFLFMLSATLSTQSTTTDPEKCFTSEPFICSSGERIHRNNFCDFESHCSDGKDEIIHNKTIHTDDDGFKCPTKHINDTHFQFCLLPNEHKCDGVLDCLFGWDECDCNTTIRCKKTYDTDPEVCIPRSHFCDGSRDCPLGEDEITPSPGVSGFQCPVTKLRHTSSCMLPTEFLCDGISDCDNGIDECFCNSTESNTTTFINDRCFRCLDGSLVIPNKKRCDNVFHCKDLSDECLCPDIPEDQNIPNICKQIRKGEGVCKSGEILCKKDDSSAPATCINKTNVCDETYDCPFHEDELNCVANAAGNFNCSDGLTYIPMDQRCDNYQDCGDGSDEESCDSELFQCHAFYYQDPGSTDPRMFNSSQIIFDVNRPRYTTACDGIANCESSEDECNATLCPSPLPDYCYNVRHACAFTCNVSKKALIGKEVCDQMPDCNPTDPPKSDDELNCPNRFYCEDKGATRLPIHIPESAKCNNVSDCFDESDEMNCTSKTHFYCEPGTMPLYLPQYKVCNGIQDCQDGEDECQNCSKSPISSDSFLISSYVLQVFVWIIGIFATFGNIGVILHNTRQLYSNKDSLSPIAYNHRILVTNLALADLFLGIYLISLGVANSAYSEIYCRRDIQWRASRTCSGIGAIALISVQCSVFLLTIMATMRLFLVARPMNTVSQRRYIFAAIFFAWFAAFILALAPLSESQTNYFVSEVWYEDNPFLALVERKEMEDFTTRLWALQGNGNNDFFAWNTDRSLTWKNMIDTVSQLNENSKPSLYFGYYSAHGVCLPRIFPDSSTDRSWGFSLFLIIINFLAFIYMLCAYTAIYSITIRNSQRAGATVTSKSDSAFQRKITRIILTNFCCWIPICIMGFVSAGGGTLSEEAYAVSAIILLPINSAFNPFLYSDLPDLIWKKVFAESSCGRWVESRQFTGSTRRHVSMQTAHRTKVTDDNLATRPSTPSTQEFSRL